MERDRDNIKFSERVDRVTMSDEQKQYLQDFIGYEGPVLDINPKEDAPIAHNWHAVRIHVATKQDPIVLFVTRYDIAIKMHEVLTQDRSRTHESFINLFGFQTRPLCVPVAISVELDRVLAVEIEQAPHFVYTMKPNESEFEALAGRKSTV